MHSAQQQQLPPPAPVAPQPFEFDPRAAPRTAEDVQALRIRLNDLRRELQDAAERRNSIAGHLRSADIDARPGYQARLQVLDSRILAIENEITSAGAQLRNAAPSALIGGTEQQFNPELAANNIPDEVIPIVAIVSIFVLAPFAIAVSRFIWKRSVAPARPALADHATQQRLEHLQQAVDTIAIEVERISENQRFVTRLLSDRTLAAGPAEPVRAPAKSAIPSERG
jgi:hypothetical protein